MIPAVEILRPRVVAAIMEELQDVREKPADLWFLNRTPVTPAEDHEIYGRFLIRGHISDILTNNARARTYRYLKTSTFESTIPNIKHGVSFNEDDVRRIMAARASSAGGPLPAWVGRIFASAFGQLLDDIRARWESMIIGAYLDTFIYDRLGFKFTSTWGMPSDLKVTVSPAWTSPSTATPVDNIFALKEILRIRYGMPCNQLVMSTQAFRAMVATAEFQAKSALFLPQTITAVNMPTGFVGQQSRINLAQNVLEVDEIVLHDTRYWQDDGNGNRTSFRFWPINYVLLRSTSYDNNASVFDLGNTRTTESMLADGIALNGTGVANVEIGRYGPHAYTYIPEHLNPPEITAFGVSRSFPRRWERGAVGWLNIGTLTDAIAVGEPF